MSFSVLLGNSLLHAKSWLSLDYISLQESEAKADLFPIKLRKSGKSEGRVATDADSGSGSADLWALTSVFLFLGRQPWRRRPFLWCCFLKTRPYSVRKMTSWILMTIDVVLKHRHSSMSNQLIISHLDIVDHCDAGKWLSFLIKWTRIVHSNGLFKFDDYDTSNGIMEEIKMKWKGDYLTWGMEAVLPIVGDTGLLAAVVAGGLGRAGLMPRSDRGEPLEILLRFLRFVFFSSSYVSSIGISLAAPGYIIGSNRCNSPRITVLFVSDGVAPGYSIGFKESRLPALTWNTPFRTCVLH